MRHLIFASLLLLPAVAMADNPLCKFHADRNLDLDLSGVQSVKFVVNAFDLNLEGRAPAGKGSIRGMACGSDQETVDNLIVTQEKQGNVLVVELRNKSGSWSGWGSHYSSLKVEGAVPANMPVTVETGSGDAKVRGVASLESAVGSGDLEVYDVKGTVRTQIGSGDFKSDGTGSIEVGAVGSGDFTAKNVHGNIRIGTVGSGDAKMSDVDGNVDVGTVGSGDIDVDGVKGNLTVRSQGSGDVDHHGVSGKVDVPNKNR